MRLIIAAIVIIYLVGIGVVLAPTIEAKWSDAPVSNFASSVGDALPGAAAWPVRAFYSMTDRGEHVDARTTAAPPPPAAIR
jgi:hypothetical protein